MLSRFFQESDHLLALYARESLEELLNRITSLQMIEQTLHRHASSSENWLPAKNFRILRYDAAHETQNIA
jgi:two-component sensor histidine kinase